MQPADMASNAAVHIPPMTRTIANPRSAPSLRLPITAILQDEGAAYASGMAVCQVLEE
jgi:hypothetical protein